MLDLLAVDTETTHTAGEIVIPEMTDTHEMIEATGTKAIIDMIAMMTGFVIHPVASDLAHQDVVVTNAGAPRLLAGNLKKEEEWKWTIGDTMIALALKMVVMMNAVAETMTVPLLKDGKNPDTKRRTVFGGEKRMGSTDEWCPA